MYDLAGSAGTPPSHAPQVYPVLERPGTAVGSDDTAYYAVESGFVAVLFNGTVAWEFACAKSAAALTSPALTKDGSGVVLVCSGASSTTVALLDTASGDNVWQSTVDAEVLASPIIDDVQEQVFIATVTGTIEALLLASGTPAWDASASTGQQIQGTPCFDGLLLYVFTLDGWAFAFYPTTGAQAWNTSVTGGAPGFSSSCAVQATTDGVTGTYVAAGALDFKLYILDTATGNTFCSYETGNVITQGVSSMNSSFLLPSSDGTLTAVFPFIGLCQAAFQITGLANPSRPAFDGQLVAIVGTMAGVYALDCKWVVLSRHLWALTITGQGYNAPAIGPNGNIYASSVQNGVSCIGVTATFIQSHTHVAAMLATAQLGSPTAVAHLEFLSAALEVALAQPYVVANANANITQAFNETQAMLKLVQIGNDPFGGSPNYVYFENPASFIALLQSDLRQELVDADATLNNFTSQENNVGSLLQNMDTVLDGYMEQRQMLEQSAQQTLSLLKSIQGTIVATELRIAVLGELAHVSINAYLKTWLHRAANFLKAAISDDTKAVNEFKDALHEFGEAAIACIFGFHRFSHKEFEEGMDDLKKAVEYIEQSAFWAAQAVEYAEAWLQLLKVKSLFEGLQTVNRQLLSNDLDFAKALPVIVEAEVDVAKIQAWLNFALAHMKKDPTAIDSILDEYVANSKALYNSDFAFYAVYQQYQSKEAQISSMV